MVTINVDEARAQLPSLLDRVLAGEEVTIARAGRPVARLTGLTGLVDEPQPDDRVPPAAAAQQDGQAATGKPYRVGGQWRGKIWIADDFDELPEDMLDLFYNGPILPEDEPAGDERQDDDRNDLG